MTKNSDNMGFEIYLTLKLVDEYQKQQEKEVPDIKSKEGLAKGPVLSLYHINGKEHILFSDYARLVLKKLNDAGISENIKAKFSLDSIVTSMSMGIKEVDGIKITNNEISSTYELDSSSEGIDEQIKNNIEKSCKDAYLEMTRKAEPKFIIPATNFATHLLCYIEREIQKRQDESLRLSYGPCDEHDSFDKNYGRFVANLEKQLQNKATVHIDEGALRREISIKPISIIDGKIYCDIANFEKNQIGIEEDIECLVTEGILKNLAIKTRDHFLGLKKELEEEKEKKKNKIK